VLLLTRRVWLSRNALIFDHKDENWEQTLQGALQDINLWQCRFKKRQPEIEAWKLFIQSFL